MLVAFADEKMRFQVGKAVREANGEPVLVASGPIKVVQHRDDQIKTLQVENQQLTNSVRKLQNDIDQQREMLEGKILKIRESYDSARQEASMYQSKLANANDENQHNIQKLQNDIKQQKEMLEGKILKSNRKRRFCKTRNYCLKWHD